MPAPCLSDGRLQWRCNEDSKYPEFPDGVGRVFAMSGPARSEGAGVLATAGTRMLQLATAAGGADAPARSGVATNERGAMQK
ncbi:hypothetical protein C7S16_3875 [Burkholderia thailandensis]|uniref:Uncharacterized protein n=1 Tax=Burkholderia thailandensis TaxID=57975 RepID=A0AAW9CYR6_BURTH|nr:hypothetical protein [Burkholderia thailandensis]